MQKETINRRKFFKMIGSFLLGIMILPIGRFLKANKTDGLSTNSKEAKFYTSSDHLAG